MRALVSRGLLVSPLVCAALVFGPAAATAAAADAGREASGTGVAQTVPGPGIDVATLLDRIKAMDTTRYDPALAPLLNTLPKLATADGTALDPARAAAYAKEVQEWSDALQKRLRQLDAGGTGRSARAADPVSDLVSAIQAAVNSLLSSLTSLDLGGVLGAVTGLLGSILDAVTGLLGSVPALPSLPAADTTVSTTTVTP
ncbi:hypothetical protein ABT075_22735 [Streptomyces sp. NPDC002677]|uniref:hypothetical protein n=1 Tax=Streptomyces sp. NPDC002677 TaxID=3154774 RepID=UPI0033306E65